MSLVVCFAFSSSFSSSSHVSHLNDFPPHENGENSVVDFSYRNDGIIRAKATVDDDKKNEKKKDRKVTKSAVFLNMCVSICVCDRARDFARKMTTFRSRGERKLQSFLTTNTKASHQIYRAMSSALSLLLRRRCASSSSSFRNFRDVFFVREKRKRAYVRDATRDVYHKELNAEQFPMSETESQTRSRLLAFSSAFASLYIGYYSAPLVSDGIINSALYMVEHENNFMRKRGLWRCEWVLESFSNESFGMVEKCLEKGAMEAVLKVLELKEKESDEEVREGARRVLLMLLNSESGKKRVDGDGTLRKRVRRFVPE